MTSLAQKDAKPSKRLRLGTRSCGECRRRRVRCIFPQGGPICEACRLHDVPCRSQHQLESQREQLGSDGDAALSQRLVELEAEVRKLHGVISLRGSNLPLPEWTRSQPATLECIRSDLVTGCSDRSGLASPGESTFATISGATSTPSQGGSEAAENFDSAPLMNLIKNAMAIQTLEDRSSTKEMTVTTDRQVRDSMQALSHHLPTPHVLRSILAATEPYWPTWPAYYRGPAASDRLEAGTVDLALTHISNDLISEESLQVAKAVLWLALCVQQLPTQWTDAQAKLPASKKDLVNSYLQIATAILKDREDEDSHTIAALECRLFQFKLYINMGKPRKAWLSIRHALNAAFLLGLHRLDSKASERKKYVWAQLWQADAVLSLVLGLPASLSVSHPGISEELTPDDQNGAMHLIAKIANAVIERDQTQADDYAATVRLDQEWQRCRSMIPTDWWDAVPPAELSLSSSYNREGAKLMISLIGKLIHIPYLLKAQGELRFEHSRVSVLEASKQMIQAYQSLRDAITTRLVMCELMDFHAFSAAMAIAVDLQSRSSTRTPDDIEDSWQLIEGTARTLRRTSATLECNVAAQGAQVLEFMIMARRGSQGIPKHYEATIPYFGKVRMTQTKTSGSDALPEAPANALGPFSPALSSPFAFAIDPFEFPFLGDFDPEADMDSDWTTVFENFEN